MLISQQLTSGGNCGGGTEEIDNLIDESGVLEDTEGTVTEKVEELIDKAVELDVFMYISDGSLSFKSAKTFPTKAVVNFPNTTTVFQAFSYWNTDPIPIVEELTVKAPNISVSSSNSCMGQLFAYNNGVKKVILSAPDESQFMNSTFVNAANLEKVVLEFSTKNIKDYTNAFSNCKKLKIIGGVLDFSSATTGNWIFSNCYNLEKVTFEPNTLSISMSLNGSSKLTSESVQSIINGLATVTTAQTLTLNSTVLSQLSDEQWQIAEEKNWVIN